MAARKQPAKASAKAPAKRAPAKRASARKPAGKGGAKQAAGRAVKARANAAAQRAKDTGATGKRLTGPKAALRDSMIIARAAQGVPWADIGKEAGISARSCQRVVENARGVRSPLEESPMALLESLTSGFLRSISDYEGMAFAWAETNQSASLGAKKAADETRMRLATLLADVGKLPSNLELFRSEMQMQLIAEQMGAYLLGVRDGSRSPEEAIEFFRGLVTGREQAQLGTGA